MSQENLQRILVKPSNTLDTPSTARTRVSSATVCECLQNSPDADGLRAVSSRQKTPDDGRSCWDGPRKVDHCWPNADAVEKGRQVSTAVVHQVPRSEAVLALMHRYISITILPAAQAQSKSTKLSP